uniref:Uncharacterized protein n=1 Tax=Nicotiana tabacum TaxID=4097 RepID=A0A1S3XG11_TOBAC|nr:PREDICTED: uncharacterized protein LOC107764762 [Nicotiana tabacum]
MGLDPMNQSIAKKAADGSFMDKTFARVTQILDKMAEHNQAWHSEDTTSEIAYGTPSLTNMIKENQERDQVIAGLAKNVNVLMKMYIEAKQKKVNMVEMFNPCQMRITRKNIMSKTLKEVIKCNPTKVQDNKTNGGLTRKGKATNSGETTKKESSSSESKLENMLERVLQNQERSDTSMKNMTELVGSQYRIYSKVGDVNERSLKRVKSEAKRLPKKVRTQEVNYKEVKEKVIEAPKTLAPIPRPPPPFPQRLARKVDDSKLKKFYDILKQLSVDIPFVEAFQEMSGFAKYLKELITKKRTTKNEVVNVTHRVSFIIATTVVQKKEDPGAFTIPCTIGLRDFALVICDNGASINLMSLAIYKQEVLGMPRPTSMRLKMVDRSIKRPMGVVDDVLVKVGKFLLPADFVILDCAINKEIPIILGRQFLSTRRVLMDSE